MTSPPILAALEWQARQFFCRMGATCELKFGAESAGRPAAANNPGDTEPVPMARQNTPQAIVAEARRNLPGWFRMVQYGSFFKLVPDCYSSMVKHKFLAGQQCPTHIHQCGVARVSALCFLLLRGGECIHQGGPLRFRWGAAERSQIEIIDTLFVREAELHQHCYGTALRAKFVVKRLTVDDMKCLGDCGDGRALALPRLQAGGTAKGIEEIGFDRRIRQLQRAHAG